MKTSFPIPENISRRELEAQGFSNEEIQQMERIYRLEWGIIRGLLEAGVNRSLLEYELKFMSPKIRKLQKQRQETAMKKHEAHLAREEAYGETQVRHPRT
jgi:hypothetical protein